MTTLCSNQTHLAAPSVGASTTRPQAWQGVAALALGSAAVVTAALTPAATFDHVTGIVPASGIATPVILAVMAAVTIAVSRTVLERAPVFAIAASLFAVALVGSLLAPNPEIAQLSRMLGGLALGGFLALAVGLVARLARVISPGRAAGLVSAGLGAGVLLGISASALLGGFSS